jgi:putative ABC transport system permease protein
VTLDAMSPGWIDVNGGDIVSGRDFTPMENQTGSNVVLVNGKIVDKLFLGVDPVGKSVHLGGQLFTVIGVYHPLVNAFDSGDKGKVVVPFLTAYRKLNVSTDWMDITVKPRDDVNRDEAMDQVITTLRSVRHLRPAQANDFFASTPEKLMQLYNQIVGVFFLVMMVLSAVGLCVGGVGVIAIMMISVTERTREIGVRKALGATKATILWQFLVEAATLTTVGAVLGLGVGALLTWGVRSWTSIAASTPPIAIIAALSGSALAGIVFGLLPAVRAARLDPVEALRYE